MLLTLMGCSLVRTKPPTLSEKRLECINNLMYEYAEYAHLSEIATTCKEVVEDKRGSK